MIRNIYLSIKNHKQDSLIIFLIMFLLSFFINFYGLFYKSSDSFDTSINQKVKVGINIDNITSFNNEGLLNFYNENKYEYFDEFFDSYKNYFISFKNKIDNLKQNENVDTSEVLLKNKMLLKNGSDVNVYSFDQDIFEKENFVIEVGRMFLESETDQNTNYILAREDISVNHGDYSSYIETGDIITLIDSSNNEHDFEVIGTFKYNGKTNALKENNGQYSNSETDFILTYKDVVLISSYNNLLSLSNPNIKVKGIDNAQVISNCLSNELNGILISDGKVSKNLECRIEINDSLAIDVSKPIKNMKTIMLVISIIMISIMLILLYSLLKFIGDKRKKNFGIFIALGQSKIKTIINFVFEVIIIYSLAFILSLPFAIKLEEKAFVLMNDANLSRQETIAKISRKEDDIDIFEVSDDIVNNYKVEYKTYDFILTYCIGLMVIIVSGLNSFACISFIKPRELMK